jgi:hypothetical protein
MKSSSWVAHHPPLEVTPHEILFENAVPGTVYVMNISLRNNENVAQRIRLSAPKTSNFAVNYIPSGVVAPGLDVRVEVQCCIPEKSSEFDFTDSITATMGSHKIEIPLLARKIGPVFVLPPVLELGAVPEGQSVSGTVEVENKGPAAGTISLEFRPESKLQVTPWNLSLSPAGQPGSRGVFTVKYAAGEVGPFREIVLVTGTGIGEPMLLDVSAEVVVQKITLLSAKKKVLLDEIDFGTLIFGQQKVVDALLVNTSPLPISFAISTSGDGGPQTGGKSRGRTAGTRGSAGGMDADSVSDDISTLKIDCPIDVSPKEGSIDAYAQVPIKFTYRPVLPRPQKGFLGQILHELAESASATSVKFKIESTDIEQSIAVATQGSAVLPNVQVSPTVLRFGTCPVLDRRDMLMTIKNSTPLALPFEFTRTPHFKLNPMSGVLQPEQTVTIVASFTPGQLGNFKVVSHCDIGKGLKNVEIRFVGDAEPSEEKRKTLVGGLDAGPSDFKTELKFVDAEAVKVSKGPFKRLQPWETINFQQTNSTSLNVYDQSGSKITLGEGSTLQIADVQELQRKAQNRSTFNSFLKESYNKRLLAKRNSLLKTQRARGINIRSDPDGVDLGMEAGLDEPELEITDGFEPLWLAKRSGTADGRPSAAVNNVDENRLISKKFKEFPTTQAEIKDCSAELSIDHQKLLVASHKVINFGKVCVYSVNAKNFAVTNGLSSIAFVKLGTMEPELKLSKPASQVIPGGALAGFDIVFSTRECCKFKKTFTWVINNLYANKVTVMAEVVPIEVLIDRKNLVLDFPPSSLEASTSQDVILTNPGNANAEFVWGNEASFECIPERGVIPPGGSVPVTVVWAPDANRRNEADLGLRITGGESTVLHVKGSFIDAKASFKEKRINLDKFAVGTERRVEARLQNTGTSPLVFFMEDPHEDLAISITPRTGIINAGEYAEINFRIAPRTTTSYDGKLITACIRGGKSASLKLQGEATIPQIKLAQAALEFGGTVVGSDYTLPISLSNTGATKACLIIDLSNNTDFRVTLQDDDFAESLVTSNAMNTSKQTVTFTSSMTKQELQASTMLLSSGNANSANNKQVSSSAVPSTIDDTQVNAYKIVMPPDSRFNGFITFNPSKPRRHNFRLPIYLQGRGNAQDLLCDVSAVGLESRLHVSSFCVDFGDKIVRRDPSDLVSYFQEVTFTNVDKRAGLSYEIVEAPSEHKSKDDEAQRPIFFISPMRGDLPPGESGRVRLTFMPPCNGEFHKKLHIYVDGQPDRSRPYFILSCVGSAVFPRLKFSRDTLYLPPVPLSVVSRASVTVMNDGYENLQLRYRVSPTVPIPLDLSFPDGEDLSTTKSSVRVIISARSESPVSWTGKIEFYDNDGEQFYLDVSGCSDSCLLTNYSFVHDSSKRFGFLALDGKPVQYLSRRDQIAVRTREMQRRATAANPSEPKSGKKSKADDDQLQVSEEGVDIENEKEIEKQRRNSQPFGATTEADVAFMLKWMNEYLLRRPIDPLRFIDVVLDSKGDVIVDAIEQMSGKKVTGLKVPDSNGNKPRSHGPGDSGRIGTSESAAAPPPGSNPPEDQPSAADVRMRQVKELLHKYKGMIEFIVRHGGLLMHVSPKRLLRFDDYVLVCEEELQNREGNRVTKLLLKEKRQLWQKDWASDCKTAWCDVLIQSFKVFVLYRTSFREYCATPGVTPPAPSPTDVYENAALNKKKTSDKRQNEGKGNGAKIPAEFAASNVYSTAEAILLAWSTVHMQRGAHKSAENNLGGTTQFPFPLTRRLADLEAELADPYPLLHLVYSHCPEQARDKAPLAAYTSAELEHSRDEHFRKLKAVLKALQLDFDIESEDLFGSARRMLIFLVHLFSNLPSLLPKAVVEFRGALGAPKPLTKAIELRNPSQRRVTYRISLTGSADYSVPESTVCIEPESSADVIVQCSPRFMTPSHATLTFRGIRDNGFSGSTIVFSLVSAIDEIRPLEVHAKEMPLYEMDTIRFSVTNPFPVDCAFVVSLAQKSSLAPLQSLLSTPAAGKLAPPVNLAQNPGFVSLASLARPPGTASTAAAGAQRDDALEEVSKIINEPFWMVDEGMVVNLQAKASTTLTISVIPFLLGTHTCQVIFMDPLKGQFCHDVAVTVGLPNPERLSFSMPKSETGAAANYVVKIASNNTAFDRAVNQAVEQRVVSNKKAKVKTLMQSLLSTPAVNEANGASAFIVDMASPNFICQKAPEVVTGYVALPMSLYVIDPKGGKKSAAPSAPPTGAGNRQGLVSKTTIEAVRGDGKNLAPDAMNSMLLAFTAAKPGAYKTRFIIYCKDNFSDVRVFDINANVAPLNNPLTIEFRGAARQRIEQEIPLFNETETDWNLVITTTGKAFTAPKSLVVRKGQREMLPVSFCPPVSGPVEGTVSMKNTNGDVVTYKLRGFAEEPFAEGTLQFKCNARTRATFSVPVTPLQDVSDPEATDQMLDVEIDIPSVTGESQFRVPLEGSANYVFSVMSPVSRILEGSITFKEPKSGELKWYLVNIQVNAPLAERVIKLEAPARKIVAVEIGFDNPTTEDLEFEVTIVGEGLIGENRYLLPAPSPSTAPAPFEVIYSPLVEGASQGSVMFKNSKIGEFWYDMQLRALPPENLQVEPIECMIGMSATVQVPVENPLETAASFSVRVSDSRHFAVDEEVITLDAFSQSTFNLSFRPSVMNDVVRAQVFLSNPMLGEICYDVSGKGTLPGVMPTINMLAPMNQMDSKTIVFKNPFSHPLPIDIVLTHAGSGDTQAVSPNRDDVSVSSQDPRKSSAKAFAVLLRKTSGLVVAPDSSMQVGVTFTPEKLGRYSASVEVRASFPGRTLTWCYPVVGMAEAGEPLLLPRLITPVKTSIMKDIQIPLVGLLRSDIIAEGGADLKEADFYVEQVVKPEFKTQIARSFRIQFLEIITLTKKNHLSSNNSISSNTSLSSQADYALRYRLLFEPLRVLNTEIELGIVCKNRGRWRADLAIEATEPVPDDVITLVAPVGGIDRVSFSLSNRFLGQSPFQAYFGPHSSPHFTVSPSAGVLDSFDGPKTQFIVTFAPREYGIRERYVLYEYVCETSSLSDCCYTHFFSGAI